MQRVIKDGKNIFVQVDIFNYAPIRIIQKPSLLKPFRPWIVQVGNETFEFPYNYNENTIAKALIDAGKIKVSHFAIFDFCGYKVLSSENEGTYIYSPYSMETYYISPRFVKHKSDVAEEILNNLHKIPVRGERDRISLCAKKVLKHPTELQLLYQV